MLINFFKKFDQYVTTKVEDLKQTPQWTKVNETLSLVPDEKQFLVKSTFCALFVLVPLLTFFILQSGNSSLQEGIALRKKILAATEEIQELDSTYNLASNTLVSPGRIDAQADVNLRLSNASSAIGVDPKNLMSSSFEKNNGEGVEISSTSVDVKFSFLSTAQLFSLLSHLNARERAFISNISIQRNAQNTLDGVLKLVFTHRTFAMEN